MLHHLSFNKVNPGQVAGAEPLDRYVLRILLAARRHPRALNFTSTALTVGSLPDAPGGALLEDFARFVADEQKADTFTLKQQWLYAEEEDMPKPKPQDGEGDAKR